MINWSAKSALNRWRICFTRENTELLPSKPIKPQPIIIFCARAPSAGPPKIAEHTTEDTLTHSERAGIFFLSLGASDKWKFQM